MKAIYRHKKSNDLFAIETDASGKIISIAGPLLTKDLDPNHLNYDNYFTDEVKAKIKDLILLSKEEYLKILADNGFSIASTKNHLF